MFFYQIPPSLGFEQAVSVPVGLATAALGLYNDVFPGGGAGLTAPWDGGRDKYTGQPIVVIGGSSSVGQYGTLRYCSLQILKCKFLIVRAANSHTACQAFRLLSYNHDGLAPQLRPC